MSYIGNEPIVSATRTVTEVSATAGQTVFTANGGYTVGFIDVFVNGSKLTNSDFTATNGTTITLNEAAQASDIVRLEALGTFLTGNHVPLVGDSNITGNVNVSGNVGIGTSSPVAGRQLTLAGGANDAAIGLRTNSSGGTASDGADITLSTGNLLYITNRENGAIVFENNGSERMRIDASGRVTTPFQPAFLASFSTAAVTTVSTGSKVLFNATKFDVGSNFSTANNRYTAPVAGVYKFTASFHITTTTQNRPVFRVNGSDYFITSDAAQSLIQSGAGGDWCLILDCLIQLNANDFVEIFARTGGGTLTFYSGHTWWSGFLVG